jgi:hypothetical protein
MMVAALLDVGADRQVLMRALDSIPDNSFHIQISRVQKSGVDCCDFAVILDKEHENHDHDMEYLHGHEHPYIQEQTEDGVEPIHGQTEPIHKHNHVYEQLENSFEHHEQKRNGHHHVHAHRGMAEILQILGACEITESARQTAIKIFEILAQAESKAHNVPMEEVHFHEVGAIDSIIDIVAVAVCLDNLGVEEVIIPKLCEGTGTVRCQHGILSVPVPAVTNIVAAHHLKMQIVNVQGELITPTGAATAAAIQTSDKLPEEFVIHKVGMGAGKRQYERPSIVRVMLIEATSQEEVIYKLESNIDDCSGEALGYVLERLFEAGARDVHYIPVFMKKNRPAWLLNVICKKEDIEALEQIIFSETTTIGIRRIRMERSCLARKQIQVETPYGVVMVKVCEGAGVQRFYPEYESVKQICQKQRVPYIEMYHKILHLLEERK